MRWSIRCALFKWGSCINHHSNFTWTLCSTICKRNSFTSNRIPMWKSTMPLTTLSSSIVSMRNNRLPLYNFSKIAKKFLLKNLKSNNYHPPRKMGLSYSTWMRHWYTAIQTWILEQITLLKSMARMAQRWMSESMWGHIVVKLSTIYPSTLNLSCSQPHKRTTQTRFSTS